MHAYILLDRTGSMQSLWTEALGSVNAYAKGLAEEGSGDAFVTLAVFDAPAGAMDFEVLRDGAPAAIWKEVTEAEASPRGMTPLFDAIGAIIARAEKEDPQRAVLVFMTDGAENASREMTKEDVKAALARVEKKGWQVLFLGADFAKFADADAVGIAANRQMAMAPQTMESAMRRFSAKSKMYFKSAEAIVVDQEDRANANEEDVKRRNR